MAVNSECDLTANAIRYRKRAMLAEADLEKINRAYMERITDISKLEADLAASKEVDRISTEALIKANSAYQRIFDEKAECCAYIAKLAVKDAEIAKLEKYLQTAMFWFCDMKIEIARLEEENLLVVEVYKK